MPDSLSDAPLTPCKPDLRRAMTATLRTLAPEVRASLSERICARLEIWWKESAIDEGVLSSPPPRRRRPTAHRVAVHSPDFSRWLIASYLALPQEPNLDPFLTTRLETYPVAIPRGTADEAAPLYPLRSLQDVEYGPFGTREPRLQSSIQPVAPHEVSLWLVPGLAFDAQGHRLGRGGGWYDRVLSRAHPDALLLGVGFDLQFVPSVPHEAHDIQLDGLITESRIIKWV